MAIAGAQPGVLDRRVVIKQGTEAQDDHGQFVPTWSTLATVWARFRALNGTERFVDEQIRATVEAEFVVRWRSDVTPKMRISWDSETWQIEAVLEEGRREYLRLLCTAARDD